MQVKVYYKQTDGVFEEDFYIFNGEFYIVDKKDFLISLGVVFEYKTIQELETFVKNENEKSRIQSIKERAGKIILDKYPTFKQQNALMGIYGQVYLDEMVTFIANIKQQSDALELDVAKTSADYLL